MYYIGVDGGGSFSRLVAVDKKMNVIGRHTGASLNLQFHTESIVRENLSKLIHEFHILTNTQTKDCSGICIGTSHLSTAQGQDSAKMVALVKELGFMQKILAVQEVDLLLATETKGDPGIAIISSADALGYAIDIKGKRHQCGGWGHLIDGVGSAYWIGMQAIRQSLMAHDGRGEPTLLLDKVKEYFKITKIEDILSLIYSDYYHKTKIAELAVIVRNTANEKDAVAIAIENHAAVDLFAMAETLIAKHNLDNHKIILSGHVLLLNDRIRNSFTALIKQEFPNMEIIPLRNKPEMGAIFLAMSEKLYQKQ